MSDFWLRILGVDPSRIPDGAHTEFIFTDPPRSWGVFVMIAVLVGVVWGTFWLYRRERTEGVTPRARYVLAGVRSAVLIVLLIVLMGPALAISTQRTIEPYVVVLVDESISMAIEDRYPDPDDRARIVNLTGGAPDEVEADPPKRFELVNDLLTRDNAKLLSDLTRRGKVRVMTFANREPVTRQTLESTGDAVMATTPAGEDEPATTLERSDPVPPLNPTGQGTDLARAIRGAMRDLAGSPIAGIVIISDGQNTEGDDPLSAADQARQLGIPIFTIGVGDASDPRNIKVADVAAPDSVFRDDPFIVDAQVVAEGLGDRTVSVELVLQPLDVDGSVGAERVVERKDALFVGDGSGGSRRVRFEYKPDEAGDYIVTVRVAPEAGEVIESDNARSKPVSVLSDKARVLLIAGAPSWEYRMISTLLRRDRTTDVSCWLQSMDPDMRQEGNTVIDRLPATPEELFQYDVVIFIDPSPADFNEAWVEALRKFLGDHAGGMMWVSGPKYSARFFTWERTAGIGDLMPVRIEGLSALDIESLIATHSRAWPLALTPDGTDHVLARLDADPQMNQRMWQAMPGIYWSFPTRAAKPGSKVLLEHSNPRLRTRDGQRPLLVTGQFGPGRTVYMGFSGTWRWRKLGEKYFDQYWVQSIRYLVEGRLLGAKKRGRVGTDRDVYPVGSRVQITAKLYDAAFDPLEADVVPAVIKSPGGEVETFELRAVANQAGDYEGTVIATRVGLNEIAVSLPGGGDGGPVRAGKQITVKLPDVETADPRLHRALLTDLARRTAEHGGMYFEIDQAGALPAAVPDRHETIVIKGKPAALWDTSRLIGLLLILLTVEWATRKRMKMM